MNIIVCVRTIPDITIISLSGTDMDRIDEGDLVYTANPSDRAAVELAVRMKKESGDVGTVTILSVCPPENEHALRECLSTEISEVIRIWDPALSQADSHVTGVVLARAIAIEKWDLILTGHTTSDTKDYQLGYTIAGILGIPTVSNVTKVELARHKGAAVVESKVRKNRRDRLEVGLPALLAVETSVVPLVYGSLQDRIDALRKEIRVWTRQDLELPLEQIDSRALRLELLGVSVPKPRPKMTFTPDRSLPAQRRMQLIMSGGITAKNQERFEGDAETLSAKFIDFIGQLNIDIKAGKKTRAYT